MISSKASDATQVYFGWKVAFAAFVVAAFGFGVGFYGPPVFLRTLHVDRGWPISTISAAITTHFLFGALCVAFLPEAHRRWGIARVTAAGAGCAAIGIVAWANAGEAWQLFPIALISGAGWAATSGAAVNAIVAPWFDKDRPRALSFAFNGATLGGLVFTPLWAALIDCFGFARAAALIAAALLAILLPVSAQYLRPAPVSQGRDIERSPTTKRQLLRDRGFITISAACALGLFAQVGLFAHLVIRLTPVLGADRAAWAISLVSVCAVLGRSLFRRLLDDGNRRRIAALNFLVQAVGTLVLAFASGFAALLGGCVLFGLGVGNLTSLPPLIIQKEFSATDVGKAVALTVAINQAVFAFAPAVLGAIHDAGGGYAPSFALAAAIQLASACIILAHRKA
jgi:predicted MFS family arabinose efflux permease